MGKDGRNDVSIFWYLSYRYYFLMLSLFFFLIVYVSAHAASASVLFCSEFARICVNKMNSFFFFLVRLKIETAANEIEPPEDGFAVVFVISLNGLACVAFEIDALAFFIT